MWRKLIYLFVTTFLLSCSYLQPKEHEGALARVGERFLYEKDLANLGIQNLSAEDSTTMVQAYIESWVRKESLRQHALENLSEAQLAEVNQKVEDYQQSLFMHVYENQLTSKQLDTLITEPEIEAYYQAHQNDFALEEPIIRYILLKRDQDFKNQAEIASWLKQYQQANNDSNLVEYCSYNTINCFLDTQKWVKESELVETIQRDTGTTEAINTNPGRLIALHRANYYYLYQIFERIDQGVAPLDYVEEKIRKTIIRNREKDFVENLRNQIYNRAKEQNEIEIY